MELDHLAIAASTLDEASDAVEAALGVALQPGGNHPVFGTHNRLLGLADGLYLEAIAIDPDAPDLKAELKPGLTDGQSATRSGARWFDLDRFSGPARLSNWICRVPDLDAALAGQGGEVGAPVSLARGDLAWRMAVPQSGRLPYDNMFPALIEWQGDLHPAAMLDNSGCRLLRLVVAHPQAVQLQNDTGMSDSRVVFETGEPSLWAEFETPHGRRVLQ